MKKQILVVDDEEPIRVVLGDVLKGNYHVEGVDSGAALKKMFSGPEPDVILLDLKLEDADGLKLLPQIKKNWPETEVIVLTGHATAEAALEATRCGAFHFLRKPFDFANLHVTVERAIEHRILLHEISTQKRKT